MADQGLGSGRRGAVGGWVEGVAGDDPLAPDRGGLVSVWAQAAYSGRSGRGDVISTNTLD